MLDLRLRRLFGSVAIAAMLLLPAAGVSAAAPACTMTVQPASGPPGTKFTFSGSGYTPSEFQLTQGTLVRSLTVDLAGADPWTYSFVAGDTDTGKWKVKAAVGNGGCVAATSLRVTLPPTATVDPGTAADRTPALAALAGLVGVFVVSAGVLFRRSRRFV